MINDPSSKSYQSIFQRDETKHTTEKPVALCQFYIENSTKRGEIVLDPFMGSGTTGVASIRSRRKFVGIELTEQWFDVSRKRIEQEIIRPNLFEEEINLKNTDLFEFVE